MQENFTTQFKEPTEDWRQDLNTDASLPAARTSLKSKHSAYYRSKLFASQTSDNKLLNAAMPLLAVASKLKTLTITPDLDQLFENLCHEIKAFENKLQNHNYHLHAILAARYALCAFIDEVILNSTWGNHGDWRSHNLLNAFQREAWGGERFFLILERSCEEPKLHIDLLELMYLCLSLGFEGKYRNLENGHHELAKTIDELYEIIHQHRGEFSKSLNIELQSTPVKAKRWILPLWLAVCLAIALLVTVYGEFNYLLNISASPIYQALNQLKKSAFNEASG